MFGNLIMMRSTLAVVGLMLAFSATFYADNIRADDIQKTYQKTCAICHVAGVAGAPKTGNQADWEPRLQNGIEAMVQSVVKGKGAMPPKGMCTNCSDEEFKALVEMMLPK